MSKALQSTNKQLTSSQHSDEPGISREEFNGLPRVDKIYYSVVYPKYFQRSYTDDDYLELMKLCFSILISATTEFRARQLVKQIRPNLTLDTSDALELIRCTKIFFGKIHYKHDDFDRMYIRERLRDVANRARLTGDIKNERLALKQLTDLDALAIREAESEGPVVPELPNVKFSVFKKPSDVSDAIIESQPIEYGTEEE